ncbi:MAG: YitT family protein [Acholeplasma sp.]|nr:YitT family protein [Acholeplasma sp.]
MNKKMVQEFLNIVFGVTLMTLGFYFFLLPEDLVIGGVMGLAVVFQSQINPTLMIYILNIGLLIIGLLILGKSFFIRTVFGSIASPLILSIIELMNIEDTIIMNQVSDSKLIIAALSGSILVGLGLGLVFRNGGTTGGMDIIQNILHKKLHFPYQFIFYFTDGVIVILSLIVFKDVELFIYAVASVFLTSLIVDNVSIKGRASQTMFIISKEPIKVKEAIYKTVDRGCTLIDAEGGYSSEKSKLIICTMNQREVNRMRSVIDQIDPLAFTFMTDTKEAVGRGFSKD